MKRSQWIGLVLGGIGFVSPFFVQLPGLSYPGHIALSIFIVAAVFWIFEPIPVYATSMGVIFLQVFLLSDQSVLLRHVTDPAVLGGYEPDPYSVFYATLASPIIMLFLGGFTLAAAAVKFDLDRNLTRYLLKPFGTKPRNVCLGLMAVTAALSAFMSNTATTAMMMTVVLPIAAQLKADDPFKKLIVLAIPVAANIGGIATPIGSPPNAIALAALRQQGVSLPFTTWMLLAAPLAAVMLVLAWRVLVALFPPRVESFQMKLEGTFQTSRLAIAAYAVFAVTVLLWITEKLHGIPSTLVAFIPVALLPALKVLDKKDIRGFSWEVLWLVAGGISLGISMENTQLAAWMIDLVPWNALGAAGVLIAFAFIGYLAANLISHTVTATILVPLAVGLGVSGAAGPGFNLGVAVVMIGVVVSFSMCLPISTPPNAIAMSSGTIETRDMARVGGLVGAVAFALALLCGFFFWPLIVK